MKNILIITILLSFNGLVSAQNWQSSIHIKGNGYDGATAFCQDANGDMYVSGGFSGQYCVLQTDTLWTTQSSLYYSFIAKFSQSGNILWSLINNASLSQTCSAGITKMVFDSLSNSILFAGTFCNGLIFNDTAVAFGGFNTRGVFGKMDFNGNLIWAKQIFGVSGEHFVNAIDYDSNDNIYIAGSTNYIAKIDTFTITKGSYLSKYSGQGAFVWAKQICGKGDSNASALNIGDLKIKDYDLFLTGGTINDTLLLDTILLIRTNSYGTLLANFDLNGNVKWAKVGGYPNGGDTHIAVAVDNNKNSYVASVFYGDTAIFGSAFITSFGIGHQELYFTKYDSNGNFKWVKQTQCSDISQGWGVAIDKNGILYLSGKFRGTAQFGNFSITSSNGFPLINNYDAFLAAYDTGGVCLGVDHFGFASATSVFVDNSNSPIVSGLFYNTVSIGSNTYTSPGPNDADAFIAKHDAITSIKYNTKNSNSQLLIHANPNEGKCDITVPDDFLHEQNLVLSIYSSSGKLIQQKNLEMNENKIKINLEAQAKGLYNAVLSNGTKSYSGKIVFE